jgi:hypothetical protein
VRWHLKVGLSELLEHLRPYSLAAWGERLVEREHRRLEWIAWLELIARLRSDPEYLVVGCAYCRRVRTLDGRWRRPAAVLQAYLVHTQRLSHIYCRDCLRGRGLA